MTLPRQERYCLFDTAIGPVGLAWSEGGMTRLQLPEADREATERRLRVRSKGTQATDRPEFIEEAVSEISRYLDGREVDFSRMRLDLDGSDPFDRQVYEAARRFIPWGKTMSYGELARQAGHDGKAREVGGALSRNPIAIVVPCHRVLAKGQRIGGFSAYGGTLTKENLLALEGVARDADVPLLQGLLPQQRR